MIRDLAIYDSTIVVVKLSLFVVLERFSELQRTKKPIAFMGNYLLPLAIGSVKSFDELGEIQVKGVGPNSNNRTISLMKFFDLQMIATLPYHGQSP